MKIAYGIAGIIAAVATFAAGYLQLIEVLLPGFLLTMALLLYANIDKITRFKAGPSGIEAETRAVIEKANATIDQMRLVGKIVARTALSHAMRAGRFGNYSDEEKKSLLNEIQTVLSDLGVSSEEQADIASDWHNFTKFDYAYYILLVHPNEFYGNAVAIDEWKALQKRGLRNLVSPDEIESVLKKYNTVTASRQELIEDYRYYSQTFEHRDSARWRDRVDWRTRFIH